MTVHLEQEAQRTQAPRRPIPRPGELLSCPICERKFKRHARQQRYCSARCRDRGRNRSRKAFLGADTRAPAHPDKSASEINAVGRRKVRSNLFANAPLNILGGYCWQGTPKLNSKTLERIQYLEIGAAP
jgi:hypothetical protein